jgi:hypothetical protein
MFRRANDEDHMPRTGAWPDAQGLISRDRLAPAGAIVLLAAVVVLLALGLSIALASQAKAPPGGADGRLYAAVIDDLARGAPYYAAATHEQRLAGFPLRPFLTVRPPALATGLALLPSSAARAAALAFLAAAAWIAWAWRLRPLRAREPLRYVWALALLASGMGLALSQGAYLFHESWAGLLIALSLALRRPKAWGLSLAVGLVAALLRELALPYLAAMALLALIERERGESAAWTTALLAASAALVAHAQAVAAATSPADLASPGWVSFGGWGFILQLGALNTFLLATPAWTPALFLPALLLPAALLGLLFWCEGGDGLGRRLGFVVLAYMAGFCVLGRSNNTYWGLLLAPLWPLGLAEIDRAIASVVANLSCGARRVGP